MCVGDVDHQKQRSVVGRPEHRAQLVHQRLAVPATKMIRGSDCLKAPSQARGGSEHGVGGEQNGLVSRKALGKGRCVIGEGADCLAGVQSQGGASPEGVCPMLGKLQPCEEAGVRGKGPASWSAGLAAEGDALCGQPVQGW